MRISVAVFVILVSACVANASLLDPVIENIVHKQASKPPGELSGIWKKKTIWKPRWVKEWKSAKVMKPIWRKVWGPVQIREWVPIPKPPPGWNSISTPLIPMKITTGDNTPLWDPVPYPESQQPPPPPAPQPLYHTDEHCPEGGCDNSQSLGFNHEQISELLTSNRYKKAPEYSQSADYSETHLTRLPPGSNTWRSPLEPSQLTFDNHFPDLPPFLVPPRFQAFSDSDFNIQFTDPNTNQQNFERRPALHQGIQEEQTPRAVHKWKPLPPQTPIKGHFITKAPDQPYKFEHGNNTTENKPRPPDNELRGKPGFGTHNINSSTRPQADGDFIQEAQLVSEYHYSEFDLPQKEIKQIQEQKKVKPLQPTHKPKTSQQTVETKPRQTRTEIKPPLLNFNTTNFHLQKATAQEIFPVFNIHPASFPTNHRFAPPPKKHQNSSNLAPDKPSPKPTVTLDNSLNPIKLHPKPTAAPDTITKKPELNENLTLQVVYSKPLKTQHDSHNTTEVPTSSTTESPPTSSSTTTQSPVFIVTPINSIKRTELI